MLAGRPERLPTCWEENAADECGRGRVPIVAEERGCWWSRRASVSVGSLVASEGAAYSTRHHRRPGGCCKYYYSEGPVLRLCDQTRSRKQLKLRNHNTHFRIAQIQIHLLFFQLTIGLVGSKIRVLWLFSKSSSQCIVSLQVGNETENELNVGITVGWKKGTVFFYPWIDTKNKDDTYRECVWTWRGSESVSGFRNVAQGAHHCVRQKKQATGKIETKQ